VEDNEKAIFQTIKVAPLIWC